MRPSARRAIRRAVLAAFVIASAGSVAVGAIPPGKLVVLDAFADPFGAGHFGALFEADPWALAGDAATPLSSSPTLYQASDLAFRADGSLVVVDRDADPSGFGPDPNGEPGPGAVLVAAAADQAFSVLSDGADYPAGLPPPDRTAFVDPRGIAVAGDGVTAFVADTDADPSDLGPDSSGFAGHGAVFSVDAAGTVRLVSDGTQSDDGPPPRAAPSWFEDPGGACVASDGSLFVLDIFGDPLATGGRGAVFRVDAVTGRIRLVGASPSFVGPGALAEIAPGRLVVSDQLADLRGDGSRGALFEIDLSQPDPVLATRLLVTDSMFRGPAGMAPAADGSLFIADPFADPLRLSRIGAIFRLRPDGSVSVASAAAQFLAPVSVKVAAPVATAPSLGSVLPDRAEAGTSLTVTFAGSGLAAPAELRMGPGITVTALRVPSADVAEADLVIDAGAAPGVRDVVFVNPDLQAARLPAAFEVLARAGPQPTSVAPDAGIQGTSVDVVLAGDRFADGATVELGPDVVAAPVTFVSATELHATVQVGASAAPGRRDVTVRNPDGLSGTLVGGFDVLEPAAPVPTSVAPTSLAPGRASDFVVDGSGFAPGMTLEFGAGTQAGAVTVESPYRARVRVFARADASPGLRDVVATNLDLRFGTLVSALRIEDAPALRFVAMLVQDDSGNASGAADPGEEIGLDILAWSAGPRALVSPVLRVSAVTGPVTVTRASVALGAAGPGLLRRPAAPYPELRLDDGAPCGSHVVLRVEILEGSVVLLDERVRLPLGEAVAFVRKPGIDGSATGARAGQAVALGDVDGDGVTDLLVGAPRTAPGGLLAAGRVSAVSGATDDPLWTRDGASLDGLFGTALAVVGDLDGDGAAEVAVGAPGEASGAGRVHLLDGRTGGAIRAISGDVAGAALGTSLAVVGDRDLDGRPDLVAGAPLAASGAGRALALALPELVVLDALDGAPGDSLGSSTAAAGDLDGDGRADAALGAPGSGAGRVVVWRADGALTFLDGFAAGERFGAALAGGADADLDGVLDLLVGAPHATVAGLADAGRVECISGRDLSRRLLPGTEETGEFGRALAFVGDLDGDGRADAAIGVPGAATDDGRVEIHGGARLELLAIEAGSPGSAGRFGECLAAPDPAGALPLLAVGAPRDSLPGRPLAGRGVMLQPTAACERVVPCDPDALEPNAPGAPAAVSYGSHAPLTICRGDVDAFEVVLPAGSRASVIVRFAHSDGDLDALLLDEGGLVVEQSLSADDDEELGPFGPGGAWEIRVAGYDGAANSYELLVLDPDTCVPAAEITGLRVRKQGGQAHLSWQPSSDPCHAPAPGPSYRVWLAAFPGGPRGGAFPGDTAFVDATAADGDGDLADESHLSAAAGPAFWLITDVSRSGDDGPSGWGPTR